MRKENYVHGQPTGEMGAVVEEDRQSIGKEKRKVGREEVKGLRGGKGNKIEKEKWNDDAK